MHLRSKYTILIGWGLFLFVALTSCDGPEKVSKVPSEIDYNLHVRPILSDKCFACHGPDANKREAGLRLDTPEGAYKELGENPGHFALVQGNPEKSELMHRITAVDSNMLMPPPSSNLALTGTEISILQRWISQGAEYKPHWAFVKPEKSIVPENENAWVRNEIDAFILAKLSEAQLRPNEEAEKVHLLKRLSFDLTGLPPSPEAVKSFLADESPEAYEKQVDRLLASKHYGEQMALQWLDVARYADSHGYQDDGSRTMWPWRDWVIHAFNENYPYNRFVTWQLAGDLLPDKTWETLLATGFNRNHKITQEGGVIDEEYRVEYVTDRTNTFGKAFLGLTYECAKCHDHKYDPISQEDYYGAFAFFDKVPEKGLFGTIDINSQADPPRMEISDDMVNETLSFINKAEGDPVQVMVMKDSVELRDTYILNRGAYDAKGRVAKHKTPDDILPFDSLQYDLNRMGLAEWLFNEDHPLTSRVYVNRVWQKIFGSGLVKTSGDFGMQGEMPTHPRLLDWLAVDFRENGWNIKRLVKQLVMSSTYRQSSETSEEKERMDPDNRFLSHQNRGRLTAENVKDMVLASSGLLNNEVGGPSVKPYQPEGLWAAATSGRGPLKEYIQDKGDDIYRRGMYTFIKRTVPPPSMLMFDASNRDQCEVRRLQTNTPLQALIMLNDPHVLEASRVMAEKLSQQKLPSREALKEAFIRIVCRPPATKEWEIIVDYYQEVKEEFSADNERAKKFIQVGDFSSLDNPDVVEVASLMQVIHTIYNMDEAITKS